MVALQFSCPHCSGLFQVDSSLGGQQVSCPHCRGVVVLPAMAGYPPPAAAPGQYPGGAGGPVSGSGGQEVPVRPPGQVLGFPPQQPQVPTGQERPLAGPQPQRPLRPLPVGSQPAGPPPSPERPLGGPAQVPVPQTPLPQRPAVPQRPAPLPQPAGQQPFVPPPSPAAWGGPQTVSAAPTAPAVPSKPVVPTVPKPRPGDAEQRLPAVPGPGVTSLGGGRLPMSGPQLGMTAPGGAEALLPPGTAGGAAAKQRTGGVGPQTPFSPASSGGVLPQPTGGPARPIMLPTPEGGYVHLREPTKTVGAGDEALELRTRSSAEKEKWQFKKNLLFWTFGLLVLGITIIILMIMGPVRM